MTPSPSSSHPAGSLLARLLNVPARRERVTHVEHVPARQAGQAQWPDWAPDLVVTRLANQGIQGLWPHQLEAADHAYRGQNVIISTGTASGKSLAYLLPALAHILDGGTILYLTPTKALAADQLESLRTLSPPQVRAACYDGDTPYEERVWVRRHANYVLTNPDMVHRTLLPRHAQWSLFWRRLRMVIIDESHGYRGVFGSHVAQILRRLRRVSTRYGASPVFMLASATASEPGVTATRLTGLQTVEVATDSSPRGSTTFALWEPPLTDLRGEGGAPVRRTATAEASDLLADLVLDDIRTLAFVRSRRAAETVALTARARLQALFPEQNPFPLPHPDQEEISHPFTDPEETPFPLSDLEEPFLPFSRREETSLRDPKNTPSDHPDDIPTSAADDVPLDLPGSVPTHTSGEVPLGHTPSIPTDPSGNVALAHADDIRVNPADGVSLSDHVPSSLHSADAPPHARQDGVARHVSQHPEFAELAELPGAPRTPSDAHADLFPSVPLSALPADLPDRVAAYRAGYLADDRRALEKALRAGEIVGLATTNALELGVDVSGLDAVLIAGWPGTRASLWQQAGRAGRDGQDALAVLIARDDPLDTYLVHHPDALFGRPVEATVLDPDNPYVLGPHLCAAAAEIPLTADDLPLFGPSTQEVLDDLVSRGLLRQRSSGWFWTRRERATDLADIRGSGGRPVEVVESATGMLLGTVDEPSAHATVHQGAVYLHQGETYVVDALKLDEGVALVTHARPDYTTFARDTTDIAVLDSLRSHALGPGELHFGTVEVTRQVVSYLMRRVQTGEILGEEPLDLPPRTLRTRAVWWTLPDSAVTPLVEAGFHLGGAAHAAEHASIGLLPLFATCDRWDIGGVSTELHPDTGLLTVFVYDGHEGGAGIAERGYARAAEWLKATREAIQSCECDHGCPSCIQSPKCGNGNDPLDKAGALHLLDTLLSP
ncbi:hypothetical protein Misp01_40700 [Microtetraspora sp. NBRC 13810]|nr:hypothetical protein Misp01_40700 [Microtetraspora sp. NBRC 13810]